MNSALASLVSRGIQYATQEIARFHENNSCPFENLVYHNVSRMRRVMERAEKLAPILGLREREKECLFLATAFQGTVKSSYPVSMPDGKIIRGYRHGTNEKASADHLQSWLGCHGNGEVPSGAGLLMRQAILATAVDKDLLSDTPLPPKLKSDSHPLVVGLVLATWGSAGMDGKAFAAEQDQYFRERNIDIFRTLCTTLYYDEVSKDQQRWYLDRMISWSLSRSGFVQRLRAHFEEQVDRLSCRIKGQVRSCFNQFDEKLEAVTRVAYQRRSLDFWSFAKVMGYACPNAPKVLTMC